MKTIKFKAKRKKDNEWVFGSYGKSFFGYGIADSDIVDTISTLKRNDQNELESECWEIIPETLCQFTGFVDSDGVEIYGDDLRTYGENRFRIYHIPGGFGIKEGFWCRNISNLWHGEELIIMPLSDPQTAGWLMESTVAAGSYHDLN